MVFMFEEPKGYPIKGCKVLSGDKEIRFLNNQPSRFIYFFLELFQHPSSYVNHTDVLKDSDVLFLCFRNVV